MKIQCHVCEAAEATVLCCADEAALCNACDEKVHAANKLASKHQRVSLSNTASQMPKCDICQEMVGYFFCLEDRALFCRKCDVAIHTANPYVSAHQRFLLTGVKVGLEATEPGSSSSVGKAPSGSGERSEAETRPVSRRNTLVSMSNKYEKVATVQSNGVGDSSPFKRSAAMALDSDYSKMLPAQSGGIVDALPSRLSFAGGSTAGSIPMWHFDDFLGLSEFSQSYGSPDNGTSKADSGKLGESDSSMLKSSEDDLDSDERLGQVPDVTWTVPHVLSAPTASGLNWPYNSQQLADSAVFVPDISWSPIQNPCQLRPNSIVGKRRRN